MSKSKPKSFVSNVLIILFAQIIVKLLGMLYRMVITNIDGFGAVSYTHLIGGGQQSVSDVTISGGIIDAKSYRGAAIGGGQQATGDSNIIISGGDITVASDFGENLLGLSLIHI